MYTWVYDTTADFHHNVLHALTEMFYNDPHEWARICTQKEHRAVQVPQEER